MERGYGHYKNSTLRSSKQLLKWAQTVNKYLLILINVDQILTKSDQILTISVKNHKIHVKTNQKCHFLKKTQS